MKFPFFSNARTVSHPTDLRCSNLYLVVTHVASVCEEVKWRGPTVVRCAQRYSIVQYQVLTPAEPTEYTGYSITEHSRVLAVFFFDFCRSATPWTVPA